MTTFTSSKKSKSTRAEVDLVMQRQQIAQQINQGMSDTSISKELQVNRRTVRAVRIRLNEANQSSLEVDLSGRKRGSKPALSAKILARLRESLRHRPFNLPVSEKRKKKMAWTPAMAVDLAFRLLLR